MASCAATSIVFAAAADGVVLTALEVEVGSRTDARGLLGMLDEKGARVPAQPQALRLQIRVAAKGTTTEALRALVTGAIQRSPIPCAVANAVPLIVDVSVDPA